MTIYYGDDPARITATKGTKGQLAVRAAHAETGSPLARGHWIALNKLKADRPEEIGEAVTDVRYAGMDDRRSRAVTRFAYAHDALQVGRDPHSGDIFVLFEWPDARDSFEAAFPADLGTLKAVGVWDFIVNGEPGQ
jgi:hypothetical protein